MRLRRSGPCRAAPRHLLGPILGTDLLPDSPMFRNLAGTAYSKDALCRAFRKNLVEVLPGDKRKPWICQSGDEARQKVSR
jgi:hypothetical protein